jgi:hypothetical protein
MKSDIYIVKVEVKPGFEDEIKQIATIQASREEPRKLVSTVVVKDFVILFFELV